MSAVSKRSRLGASALAILSATSCYAADAQTSPAGEPPADEPVVVVTGSRIRTGAMESTPTTMVSVDKLNATTPTSVQDAVMKLPAFNISSATPNSSIASNGAGYNQPGNFLDLRGLGAIHTLVLQDGNRVPSTFFDGRVDTNMLPQMLMKRVDVVTGGVSAVYGSDAVAGVVNFITDTKFNGVKGIAQGGLSNYGDAGSVKTGVAVGTNLGERGHFVGSAEFYNRSAVSDTASRAYGRTGATVVGAGSS
ncbi:MAG TPA: TonB-dependent receptor plug domain-containing protein, partial [Duganella sp.]|uniref:TonB-dependent receptor plug domain-containing protein n=1 Tax=Duganella sp. TaxID=1904440 RepID=UPI002ED3C895